MAVVVDNRNYKVALSFVGYCDWERTQRFAEVDSSLVRSSGFFEESIRVSIVLPIMVQRVPFSGKGTSHFECPLRSIGVDPINHPCRCTFKVILRRVICTCGTEKESKCCETLCCSHDERKRGRGVWRVRWLSRECVCACVGVDRSPNAEAGLQRVMWCGVVNILDEDVIQIPRS